MKMRRLRRGALLASVSASAILVMTAGGAWAADATISVGGGQTYSNSGSSITGATASPGNNIDASSGSAIKVTGSGATVNITGGTVSGGTGGAGGSGSNPGDTGGSGGNGLGIKVESGAANTTINVSQGATINAGTGGLGGAGGSGGQQGAGGDSASVFIEGGNTTVNNSGTVQVGAGATGAGSGSPLLTAVGIGGDSNSGAGATITNTATGRILGGAGTGIAVDATGATISNSGTISSTGNRAIYITPNGGNTNITNSGTITTSGTNAAAITNEGGIANITNQAGGVISATGGGAAIDVSASAQANHIYNNGTIIGNVKLGWGSDGNHVIYLNSGSLLTGNIIAGASGDGVVSVGQSGSGIATIVGNMGSASAPIWSLNIGNGSTLVFGSDSTINAGALRFVNGGTLDFGKNRVNYNWYGSLGAAETQSGTNYFKTTIDTQAQKHGYLVISIATGNGGTTLFSSGAPIIVPTVVGSVTSGAKYVVVQDASGRAALNLPTVVNSGGYHWTVSSVTGAGQTDTDGVSYGTGYTDIVLTNGGTNAAGTASGTNGAAINALASYSGSNSQLQTLSQAINNLTSDADIQKAGAQLRPEINGGTTQASLGAVNQALGTIQVRTEAVRTSAAEQTGVSSGETLMGLGTWAQGFGSHATQDRREGVDGYGANTYGLAIGADTLVFDSLRAGASLAYARTNVADTGARDGSGQKISSYIATLYGTYTAPRWYVDGTLTYGWHDYDSTRLISIAGAATEVAKASFSGQQYGAKTEFGYPIALGNTTVTPIASLAYNRLNQDGYTETGAAAALSVGSSSTDSIRSGLGSKVSASIGSVEDWSIRPNARAVWLHEFNGKAQDSTSTFVDGGSSFTTSGIKIAQEHFDIGLGLDLVSLRNTTISAKYDADLSDRYVSHTGSVQIRTEF